MSNSKTSVGVLHAQPVAGALVLIDVNPHTLDASNQRIARCHRNAVAQRTGKP